MQGDTTIMYVPVYTILRKRVQEGSEYLFEGRLSSKSHKEKPNHYSNVHHEPSRSIVRYSQISFLRSCPHISTLYVVLVGLSYK